MTTSSQTSPVQSRAALAVLAILWMGFVVLLNPMGGQVRNDSSLANYWPYVWFGAYTALPWLFAIWIALGTQPPTSRIPSAIGLAALLGVMAVWGQPAGRRADVFLLLFGLVMTCLDALLVRLLRRRYGWEVRRQGTVAGSSGPVRFTISHLILWTSATAVILVLAGLAVSDWSKVAEYLREASWLPPLISSLIIQVITLPLAVSGLGLVLADGRKRRFATLLAVAVLLLWLPISLLMYTAVVQSGGHVVESAMAAMTPVVFLVGFLSALMGSLLVFRMCGYRMS